MPDQAGMSAALRDVRAAARHDLDQALVGEYAHGLAGGQPRDPVLLHELGLGRYRAPGRVVAALDRLAQDRGNLQERLADIRRREDEGLITVRLAADARIDAMERHLDAVRRLREMYLGTGDAP